MTPRENDAVHSHAPPHPTPPKFDWLLKLIHHPNNTSTPPEFRNHVLAVAPMVDQSDLPFRLLCRRYGANLAFTPMIHARMFCEKPIYRLKFFNLCNGTPQEDRPLIVQLCGSEPHIMLQAATLLQPHCDGIDLNCGCPQSIAKRGNYGAYLLEQPELLISLVKTLASQLQIPVSVKVRLLPTGVQDSLHLYRKLQEAGASMLSIHGRNRFQKAERTGHADWNAIRQAVDLLDIPVLANGSMSCLQEIRDCLHETGAAGVMCSEALLEYPPIFTESLLQNTTTTIRIGPSRLQLAREYLELATLYPPQQGGQGSGTKCIRAHIHRFLHADMQNYMEIRNLCATENDFSIVVRRLEEIYKDDNHSTQDEQLSWYIRHRVVDKMTGKTSIQQKMKREATAKKHEILEDAAECMGCLFDEKGDS
jgi:tRNA-dihydrouridine synthase 1